MELNEALKAVEQTSGESLATVVSTLIETAGLLTGSPISYFALINEAEDVLTMVGWSKTVMNACSMMDKPIVYPMEKTGLWGDCVRERGPVVTNDYDACNKPTKKGYPAGHVNVKRHMNVCMMNGAHIAGVLGVGNKQAAYDDADIQQLQTLANRAFALLPADEVEAIIS